MAVRRGASNGINADGSLMNVGKNMNKNGISYEY